MPDNSVYSIAIGSFDGIHTAHRELISLADEVVVIERGRGRLTPGYKRCRYCEKPCSFYIFDKIKDLEAEEFIRMLISAYPNLKKIVVGYDFRFGRSRSGNPDTIREIFEGEVVVIDEVTVGGISVHSQTIAQMLSKGDIVQANRLLGREYSIDGKHISGQGLGSRELVPTINISVEDYILPKEGVYITRTTIGDDTFPSVTFLGHRETTDGSFAVETHLLKSEADLENGEIIYIEFISFIRENLRFDSLEALKSRIYQDISEAERYFDII